MIFDFLNTYSRQLISTLILIAVVLFTRFVARKAVVRYSRRSEVLEYRTNLILKYISVFLTTLSAAGIIIIWGVDTQHIITTLSAVITVIGVALFAQWSILSNITSGVILLFNFPFKIGDTIRIHDKDFPIEAEIDDIRAFHTMLRTTDGEIITYPNNLLLQKGITIVKNSFDEREFTD